MSSHSPRIAVVTGAGSGIGAAVAHAPAGDGWVVVLAGRRHEALASVAERGAELRGMLDPVPADVTGEAAVRPCSTARSSATAANGARAVATRAATEPSGPMISRWDEPSRVSATAGSSRAYSPDTGDSPASSA
jgi:NAD(P)-dependent dehydrogenase (short-subunit alcohol dehydrogenase family)